MTVSCVENAPKNTLLIFKETLKILSSLENNLLFSVVHGEIRRADLSLEG